MWQVKEIRKLLECYKKRKTKKVNTLLRTKSKLNVTKDVERKLKIFKSEQIL